MGRGRMALISLLHFMVSNTSRVLELDASQTLGDNLKRMWLTVLEASNSSNEISSNTSPMIDWTACSLPLRFGTWE